MRVRLWLCVLLALPLPFGAQAQEAWYMRVVARGNGASAQLEKRYVRDAALSALEDTPPDAAIARIGAAIQAVAPDSRVEIRNWQPDQNTPPARTVYITIGEGGGKNWWGVLYVDSLSLTGEKTDDEAVVFVWPWFDWLARLFRSVR